MGPFAGSAVEITGIVFFALLAFGIWLFNRGWAAAASGTPPAPRVEAVPTPVATITCAACSANGGVRFWVQVDDKLCDICFRIKYPTSWTALSTSQDTSRHNQPSGQADASG